MDDKKDRIKVTLQLCKMLDDAIREKTEVISAVYSKVLPNVKSEKEELAVLYQIGYLKRDLGFLRASAFGYMHNIQSKDPEFRFWLRGVI